MPQKLRLAVILHIGAFSESVENRFCSMPMLANIGGQTLDVIWLSLACLGLVLWIIATVWLFVDEEAEGVSLLNLVALLPTGLLFFALSDLSHPVTALWVWRIVGIVGAGTGVVSLIIALRNRGPSRPSKWARLGFVSSVALWIGFGIFSFMIEAPYDIKSSPPVTASAASPGMDSSAIWQTAAPIVFGVFGLVFLMLFILQVQRGDLPSIETNSGGIGGGLGGWRVSGSLTYLLGLIVFGTFFYFTLPHDAKKSSSAAIDATSVEQKKPAPPANPSPRQTGLTNPATTTAAGTNAGPPKAAMEGPR